MNDTKHTPGPWDVERAPQNESYDRAYIIECNPLLYSPQQGRRIAIVHGRSMENAEANARRIVACVNACEGISTEVLEGTTAEKLGPHLTGIRPTLDLMRQRDELLAFVERFAAFDGKYHGGERMDAIDYKFNVENMQKEARAELAKVRGSAR